MNVVVDVKEAQTGSFSAGAGFSSADSLLFNVRIQENNLFGRGQRLVAERRLRLASAATSSCRSPSRTSSTRRSPSAFDAFSWQLDVRRLRRAAAPASASQVTYPVTALGCDVALGLPARRGPHRRRLPPRAGRRSATSASTPPRSIRAEEGTSLISSITPRISRNTLNHAFDPTAGSLQDLSVEVAGLGGEQFVKAEARERWYYTFLRSKALGDFTYSLGGHARLRLRRRRASTATSCRSSSATSRAASTRSAASSRRTLGPREEPQEHLRRSVVSTTPDRRQPRSSSSTTRSSSRSCRRSA